MKAMVLAAGLGERMRPLTEMCPKPLLPIANQPVVGWVLNHLARHGFTDVIANLHYRPEEIVDRLGDGSQYGVQLTFSYEEELLGPAGGVRRCKEFFGDETFLVTGADDLNDMDLSALVESHRRVGALASIGLVEVTDTEHYGIVVTDSEGAIERFVEKPKERAPSNTANTQIYLFEPEVFDFIPGEQFYDFGFHAFPAMVEAGVPFYGFRLDGYWRDIGSISDYLDAHLDVLGGRITASLPEEEVEPGIWLGDGCDVDAEARLEAPLILGKGCRVHAGASLGGGTAVGNGVQIPRGSTLWNTVVWERGSVSENTCLCGAVVTETGTHQG
jgi:mannose-1-phosphate guanylyltransferase/phosphomannomutase